MLPAAPQPFAKGPNGKAKLAVLKKGGWQVVFEDGDYVGQKFVCPSLPNSIRSLPNGTYNIRLNRDGSEIFSLSPWSGIYEVSFMRFAGKEGSPPAPKVRPNLKSGDEEVTFTAVLSITSGDLRGIELIRVLRYDTFLPGGNGLATLRTKSSGQLTAASERVVEFFETLLGKPREEIKFTYSANMLPEMQLTLLSAKRVAQAVVKDGWIETLAPTLQPVKKSNRK